MKIDGIGSQAAVMNIKDQQADKPARAEQTKAPEDKSAESLAKTRDPFAYKAILAVDEDKNVVVRVLDKKGKIVEQIPADQYLKSVKYLRDRAQQLFTRKA